MLNSLRVRLTFWYIVIFAMLLIAFSGWLYWLVARNAYQRLDQSVTNNALTAAAGFLGQMAENQNDARVATAHTLVEFRPHNAYLAVMTESQILGANYFDNQSAPTGQIVIPQSIPQALIKEARLSNNPVLQTIPNFGPESGRLAVVKVRDEGHEFFIVVAESRHEMLQQLSEIKNIFYFSLPAILFIAALAGLLLTQRNLAPLSVMSKQAEQINAQNLHERLPVRNQHDELGRLAQIFNALLARLNRSFQSLREFTADASHELRTPLAIIRGEADIALSQPRSEFEYQETLSIIRDEAQRLSRIVEDMLSLARADAGGHILNLEEIYLNDLIEECCRSLQTLAKNKNISIIFDRSHDVEFCGDEELLHRMILNLIDNAIKYTPVGGVVRIILTEDSRRITLTVTDNGIGIPADAVAQVFDRFYRVDHSRSRAEGGSGLGLPIVKWAAEAHHGTIKLESHPGIGSNFIVELPRANSSSEGESMATGFSSLSTQS